MIKKEGLEEIEFVDTGAFAYIHKGKKGDKQIAIKSFKPAVLEKMTENFVRLEAKATESLGKQKICPQFYGYGDSYILMEFIEGVPLDFSMSRLWHLEASYEEKYRLAVEIIKAVQSVHEKSWVHLDISTENFVIENLEKRDNESIQETTLHFTEKSRVRLIDFSFSRKAPHSYSKLIEWCKKKGGMLGKRSYCSPERLQLECKENPYQQDIFSLGVLLYKLFCLDKHPYIHNENEGKKKQITNNPFLRPKDSLKHKPQEITDEVAKVIEKSLARDPKQRYDEVHQILEDLGESRQ